VCVGDEVNITCGYKFSVQILPVWTINGESFFVGSFENSSSFESPLVTSGIDTVLTVYSSDELNQTTFQCEFQFLSPVVSPIGTLTVMGKGILYTRSYKSYFQLMFFKNFITSVFCSH